MAHYDCKNCGTYGGIAWGICEYCTPEDFLQIESDLASEYRKAVVAFDELH